MDIEEFKVKISADIRSLKKSIQQIEKEYPQKIAQASKKTSSAIEKEVDKTSKKIEKSAKSTSGVLQKTFSKIKVAAVAAIASITVVVKNALNIASDIEEVQNVVDVAFGKMSSDVNDFAKSALKSFGLSELSAKQFASTFMAISNGLGIAADTGKEMSLSLTKLTGDMASFYNISQETAATALKSVFTGETESLKKYGIVLTEANLKNYALSVGIKKAYSEMTEAEKVALRYNYVMTATNQVQGDFARTSDSWANQLRILKENFKNLISVIGEFLIKVLTPLIIRLNQLVEVTTRVANNIKEALGIKSADAQTKSVDAAVSSMANYEETVEDTTKAIKELKKNTMGFDELNKLASPESTDESVASISIEPIDYSEIDEQAQTEAKNIGDSFASIIEEKIQHIVDLGKQIFEIFQPAVEAIKDNAKSIIDAVTPFVESVLVNCSTILSSLISNLLPLITSALGYIMPILQDIADWLLPIIKDVIEKMTPVIQKIIDVFGPVLQNTYEILKHIVEEVFEALEPIFDDCLSFTMELLPVTGEILNVALDLISHVLEPVLKLLKPVGDLVRALINALMVILQPIIKLISPLIQLLDACLTPIVEILSWILDKTMGKITDSINGVMGLLKPLVDFLGDVFTKSITDTAESGKQAWQTIKDIFEKVKNAFSEAHDFIKGINNSVLGFIEKMVNGVIKGLNSMIAALNKLSFDVPDWVPLIGGQKFGFNLKEIKEVSIPRLATGGVVYKPTKVEVGEAGREAIIPLDSNTGWMDKLSDKFALRLLQQQPEKIVLNIDGRQLGWASIGAINKITKQTGNLQLALS